MRIRSRSVTAAVAAGLVAMSLSGCGDDNGGSSSATATASVGASPSVSISVSASPSPSSSASPSAGAGAVSSSSTSLGRILVNDKGRTLYLFASDTSTKSTCNGGCAQAWPPVIASGKPTAGTGVKASLLSTTTRDDGKKQTTYNGHPLYTFTGDTAPGQTTGQAIDAFGAKWYVVNTDGDRITTPQSTGGGSGY